MKEVLILNEEKLNEVRALIDVDPANLKQKKNKLMGRIVFYFVQIFVLLFSSLLGYLFVLWEHTDRTGYPHGVPRHVFGGAYTLFGIHGVNATFSYFHRKKHKFHSIEIILVFIVNLIISFISFYMIYNLFFQPEVFVGTPLYSVYRRETILSNSDKLDNWR